MAEDKEMQDGDAVLDAQLERLEELIQTDPKSAVNELREFLKGRKVDEELSHYQERALFELMNAYTALKDADGLIMLLNDMKKSFDAFSKSKRENIVKTIFEKLAQIPGSDEKQIKLCREYIVYLTEMKRDFLRQRFETRLSALLTKKGEFQEAMSLISNLIKEVKKVDDKLLLVEIYLIESQISFALNNISKARSSLTAAKTSSNSVYVGVQLQSEIDLQAGVINAFEKDYRTAYSYFFEANEGFMNKNDLENGLKSFHYMLLSKILNNQASEVTHLLNLKTTKTFLSDPTVVLLTDISETVKAKKLENFSLILASNRDSVLFKDKLMEKSLKDLENDLLEQNLLIVIKPYSRVEVERIAKLMKMDEDKVLNKLVQMILDEKLRGTIDQSSGDLIVHDEPLPQKTYMDCLQLIDNMGLVVNNLIRRARVLH